MRVYCLVAFIIGMGIYAWRDWFIPVCVLVVLDAVMKHSDMPRTLFGMQGLNLWNLLLVSTTLAWLTHRMQVGRPREVPTSVTVVFFGYVSVIVVAFVRGLADIHSIPKAENIAQAAMTPLAFTSDYLINPLKYVLCAFLLFDGARTRRNLLLGIGAIFAQASLYAVQVIKYVPPSVLLTSSNPYRTRIQRECGLHANDMALVMVVAFWGLMACVPLWRYARWWWRAAGYGAAIVTFTSLALTMSRAGYLAFAAVGLCFGALRWRPLVLLLPFAVLLACVVFPSIQGRLTEGLNQTDVSGEEAHDIEAIGAGRLTTLWPPTLDAISDSPLIGYGRLGMLRVATLHSRIVAGEGRNPGHPHNAYLEVLLDSGVIGLIATLAFFAGLPCWALSRSQSDSLIRAVSGTGLAAAGTILIMGLSGQTFFPREGVFLVLCCYGLMMRGVVIEQRAGLSSDRPSWRGERSQLAHCGILRTTDTMKAVRGANWRACADQVIGPGAQSE